MLHKAKATGNYLYSMLALKDALNNGYDEALILDINNNVNEGSGENFFMIAENTIFTPKDETVLNGITRQTVMKIASDLGYKVIETIGKNITELTPSRGFAAELAAATTVVLASGTGLPISTTHTLVGAVLGVGIARGLSAIDLSVVGRIIVSWIVTLPVGAGLSILFFFTLKGIFS